ncbi:MAG: beta-galactosidase GalA [Asticcacaulis sp.]
MTDISRRQLVKTGLLLTTVSTLGFAPVAFAQSEKAVTGGKNLPREKLLFDFDWRFAFGNANIPEKDFGFGTGQGTFAKTGDIKIAKEGFDDSAWRSLNLPHDWAVELPFVRDEVGEGSLTSHGFKPLGRHYPETSIGWYRREFEIPASDLGRRIWVEFDGAFRDVVVFVNGCFIGRNNNGYGAFRFDLTDFLAYGAKNYIVVRVDASFGDGWFYEGAGIYRHVWLTKMDAVHLGHWDSYVRTDHDAASARLDLGTVIENETGAPVAARATWAIYDPSGKKVAEAASEPQTLSVVEPTHFNAKASFPNPSLWSPDAPNLYKAVVSVWVGDKLTDTETVTFGVRSVKFTANKGFLLNGQPLKLQGVCNHQDHAGVGAALPDRLQAYRVEVMQGMGCNAIRTSHNQPTPELVDACDAKGVMMMCETRQMSSNAEGLAQLEAMVKQHRNSPAIVIWSIGNEEWILQDGKGAEQGSKIAKTMVELCHELDPTRQVTAAVNGTNEQGVSDPLDVIGFNYNPDRPAAFHAKHPDRPQVGSETSSAISTRGEYYDDPKRNLMNSYTGVVGWGQTPEDWWKVWGDKVWSAGGFAWTGFDYRGEPTPYGWPSINSQFGIVDMCGFPKDYYYYYKAWWGKAPALHVFPHWDWPGKEGLDISVWVYANLDEVELFHNGKSLGSQKMPALGHLEWKVRYMPGYIEARGKKNGQVVLTERRETTGAAKTLRLTADRMTINADGEDVSMLTAEVLDEKGRHIPTAMHKLKFKVSGAGTLIGVGNGDPNCLESDKGSERSLFNGLAQLIVQSQKKTRLDHNRSFC